jgi:hypothetical protein
MNKQFNHVTILSATPSVAHLQHSHEDELSWNIIPMMINELQFESYKTVIKYMEWERISYRVLDGKPEGEISPRWPRHRRGNTTWTLKK